MPGFDYHPQPHNAQFYLEAITEILDGKVGSADRFALLDSLSNEIEAAQIANDPAARNILVLIRGFLLHDPLYT